MARMTTYRRRGGRGGGGARGCAGSAMHAANGLLWWPTAPGTERDGGEGTEGALGGCRLDASRRSSGSTACRRARRQRQGRVLLGTAGAHVGVEHHRRPQVQRRHRAHVRLCNTPTTETKRHRQGRSKEPRGDNPEHKARARATAVVSHSSTSLHAPQVHLQDAPVALFSHHQSPEACPPPLSPSPAPRPATAPGSFRSRYCMTRRRLATRLTSERRVTWSFACVRRCAVR